MTPTPTPTPTTRRDFIGKAVASAGALTVAQSAWAAGSDKIKVGLIGCGGRGAGAAGQALSTNQQGIILHAVADAYKDKTDSALSNLRQNHAAKMEVTEDRQYSGLGSYQKVIESCDLIILTTPPGFRPYHFKAAVEAGKNIFMEKPVAVDAPGVRTVLEYAKIADEKNLKVVVGLQRRYQNCYLEALKQVKEQGIIGEIVAGQVYWNGSPLWFHDKQPDQSELMYQIKNWYYFTWLCGDHINEQHIHNIDIANWFIGSHPVSAQGMGGRQQRVDKKYGQIFDHHYVEFTYGNGVRVNSQCRHHKGTKTDVREEFTGTKGKLYLDDKGRCYAVNHKGEPIWRYRPAADKDGKRNDPNAYQVEHDTLQAAIRDNKPINNAYYGAESTMTAVLGRMATYSGQEIKWDDALNSKVQHMPAIVTEETEAPVKQNADGWYPIAIPGQKVEGVEIV